MMGEVRAGRRVVVTGMGIACPLGVGVEHVWRRLINAESGITAIQAFDTAELTEKIAGTVPAGTRAEGGLDLAEWVPVKDIKKMDRFIHLAMVAAIEAVEDSGWAPADEEAQCETGVMIGSGIGGLGTIYDGAVLVSQGKARRMSPFFIPSALINLASGWVSIKYGFKGPNHSAVTACDRRCGAADHAGRCGGDGRGWGRGCGQSVGDCRVLREPGVVDGVQRPAARGVAALGPGPGRVRDGRRRRGGGA